MKNTAIIVEDEPHLRAELRDQLRAQWPELEILAEAENGIEAIRLIEQYQPQIVFLDIQIPGINGMDLAQHIPAQTQIVFVTALDEHALSAFEKGAVDYLVKPISASRLATTIHRLKTRGSLSRPLVMSRVDSENTHLPKSEPLVSYLKWLKVSVSDSVRLIMVNEVLYFQSTDKYTNVVTKQGEAIIRLTLKNLVEQLHPDHFAQIHRSTIVNLQAIEKIVRVDGVMQVHLRDRPEKLAVSESYMRQFRHM